jgi:hypothetical protein
MYIKKNASVLPNVSEKKTAEIAFITTISAVTPQVTIALPCRQIRRL